MRRTATRPASPASAEARPAGRLPLSALLSQALVAFTIEADNEAEHSMPHRTTSYGASPGAPPGAPWMTSLLMWANCLRHLPDGGVTVAELLGRARTGTNLDGMRRWGYVTFTPEYQAGRPRLDAVIAPTGWGRAARDTWQEVTAQAEGRWHDRLGPDAFAALRAALSGVVAHLDPALPDCLPILRYGLFSRPDPVGRAGRAGASRRPPDEQSPGAAPAALAPAGDLPLWALLSRTLLAFATQYEAGLGPSLAVSANVLRVLTVAGVPASDVPALAGVSKESVAMAAGWLRGHGLVTERPDPAGGRRKVIRLTPRGAAARGAYPALAAEVERDWRARFGDAGVSALRRAVEPLLAGDPSPLAAGLAPYPDNWRARRPSPATLPHYPMTLHRGGYPDGS